MQAIMPAILLVICFDMIKANEIPEDILNYEPEILIESTYKSSRYVRKPSCASHDRFGNIMLNGQMHNDAIAPFSFHSTLHEESEFSMVFCLRGEDTDEQLMCDKNGLVVCFHSYNDEFPTENLTEIPQYLAHQCKEMNGFMVKTENRAFFRIDTRYGNT
ncbi:hypothetical protein DdX_21575 [Ditylenchus destructor]|uniref:Uncharacterized protein n=1 Tax=Ditylenchus destructor TaxID=166010 RepID=A0AAD4MG94_9BILA|nr:hypothetical protein DdX_21575 [Ditylenchus destructor]